MGQPVTLEQQISACAREIAMRRNVYPKWVASKKMKQAEADHQLAAMEAVIETLNAIKALAELEVAAAPAPWASGHGDTYDAEATYAEVTGPDGKVLFDTCNSQVLEAVQREDEGRTLYVDETGERNFAFVVAARNALSTILRAGEGG